MKRAWVWVLASWLAGSACFGQGFMVRPLVIETSAKPADKLEIRFEVSNTTNEGRFTVDLIPLELGQGATGGWVPVDPNAPEYANFTGRSCRDWLAIPETTLTLEPLERHEMPIRINVPRAVRGTYAAALAVRRQPMGTGGVKVSVQFLVPILIHIQGVSALERVKAGEPLLRFIPGAERRKPTTVAGLTVQNAGETMSVVSGRVRLLRPAGEQWRLVTEADFKPVSLLPGLTIALANDLARSLPSGKYRLQTVLRVDGRVRDTSSGEIEFEGDPTVTSIAEDAALRIEPVDLEIKAVPGSHRTALLAVQNPSEAPIQVTTQVSDPPALTGVAMGDVKGTDYACADWLTIEPRSFTLPPGGLRNLKLTMNYPRVEGDQRKPNYYADLVIHGAYRDGQSAGKTQATILLVDPALQPVETAGPVTMGLTHLEGDQYAVSAKFANSGSTFWVPTAVAGLDDRLGFGVASAEMETQSVRVLPLGVPQFSGVLDLAGIDAGVYTLRVTMRFNRQESTQRLPIEVSIEDGRRLARVLNTAEAKGPPSPPAQPED